MKYYHVQFSCTPNSEIVADVLSAMLGEIGFESFVENQTGLDAYIPSKDFSENKIDKVVQNIPLQTSISYKFSETEDENWNEEWEKNYFEPIVIDSMCCVHSSFHNPEGKYEFQILIDPKMAFGTGHHQTTSLMIKEMLALDLNGKSVLDLGCGTAVLAILASMKGATEIIAIDNDEWAYANAKENVQLNNTNNIKVQYGDVYLLNEERFDVILANINRNVLLGDIEKYAELLKEGGLLLMSGFYLDDIQIIKEKCLEHGLKYDSYSEKDKWVAVKFCNESK